jgi:hypothetical protein
MRTDGSTAYYQEGYRDTHLKISATQVKIGQGRGRGASRLRLDLGSNASDVIVFQTSNIREDQDEAPIHLIGEHSSNKLQLFAGEVDVCMLPGTSGTWPDISCSGGLLRLGAVTLTTVDVSGNSQVELRSDVTTLSTKDNGRVTIFGGGLTITTMNISGGRVQINGSSAITITTLNGYGGKELDLSNCDSAVTVTNMNIYATADSPFTIRDPNNRLVMTNAAVCVGGVQSFKLISGATSRSVRIT